MHLKKQNNFRESVYYLVKKIPLGKVTTYGAIAKKVGINPKMVGWPRTELTSSRGLRPRPRGAFMRGKALARAVGNALHANTNPSVPCLRVVDRTGRLAPNFAFDGWQEQKRRLESEGVKFIDEMHVDLSKSLWNWEI